MGSFIDKTDVLSRVKAGSKLQIELGCGATKRNPSFVGVDMLDCPGVDLVGEVGEVLAALPDACVCELHAYHFLEHVEDLYGLMESLGRVMARDALLVVEVPHFSNPYYYSDPTHRTFFGLYTFCYLAGSDLFWRKVPQYGHEPKFKLIEAQLGFDSPFPMRGVIKRLSGKAINLCRWTQEFYEENLCHAWPCYQLRFVLRRQGRG